MISMADGGVDIGCAVVRPIRHDAGTADGLCANPLPVGAVPALVYGDTRTGLDTSATCSFGFGGSERIFQIAVPVGGELTIDLDNLSFDAGFKPVIGVYNDCSGQSFTRACLASHPSQQRTRVVLPSIDAGTYLVAVDGFDSTMGDFSLAMCLRSTPRSSAGETCSSPIALTFVDQHARTEGNTVGMTDDVDFVRDNEVPCSGEVDRVYSIDLPDAGPDSWDVEARVLNLTNESFSPVLVFIDSCAIGSSFVDGGVIACGPGFPSAHPAGAWLNHHLGAGRHFVWVQGTRVPLVGEASYVLDVKYARVGSAPNDLCAPTAPLLQPNTSNAGSLLGATNQLANAVCPDLSGQDGAGAEVFYRYVAPATGMAKFEIIPEVGTAYYLGLYTGCTPNDCLTMSDPSGEQRQTTLSFPVTQGTTYFVMVEEYDVTTPAPATIALGNRGAFGLRVSQ